MAAKVIQMRRPRGKPKVKSEHIPYHCDLHGAWLRDHDVLNSRRGRANSYGSWKTVREGKELIAVRTRKVVCMRCVADGNVEKFLREDAETLRAWFAGQDEVERKKGGK